MSVERVDPLPRGQAAASVDLNTAQYRFISPRGDEKVYSCKVRFFCFSPLVVLSVIISIASTLSRGTPFVLFSGARAASRATRLVHDRRRQGGQGDGPDRRWMVRLISSPCFSFVVC